MCRIYTRKNKPAFVRLCYRKGGRAGEHVPVTAEILRTWDPNGDCLSIVPRASHRKDRQTMAHSARLFMICFRVPSLELEKPVIESMQRYAEAESCTLDAKTSTVTFHSKRGWHNAELVIRRAKSFGWQVYHRVDSPK